MDRDARVPDGGSPAPLRATEIQLKETIDNTDNSPQIRTVFTVLPLYIKVHRIRIDAGTVCALTYKSKTQRTARDQAHRCGSERFEQVLEMVEAAPRGLVDHVRVHLLRVST